MKSKLQQILMTAGLLATAGTSTALAVDPVVDGKRDAVYGAPVATQKSTVIDYEGAPRVNLSITSDVSNVGGKGEYLIAGTQGAPNESDPTLVTRGVEIAIRLADLPAPGVSGVIKLAGFISGGTFVSNQVIGGLPGDPGNLGEPRTINFDTGFAGNQFISISTATRLPTAPVIDGKRDSSPAEQTAYGTRFPQTDVGTAFGSNSIAPTRTTANGSEIDGVYAYVYNNGTPGDPNDDILCLFFAGNLEPNYNNLVLFLDCAVGGQNTIARGNFNGSFNFLNRIGENADGTNPETPGTVGPGLTFDAGFAADYWIKVSHGGNGGSTTPPSPTQQRDVYVDSAVLPNVGNLPGVGTFFQGAITTVLTSPAQGPLAGSAPNNPDALKIDIDNSNSANVGAVAPNNGGVGGRTSLPGGGTQADTTSPASVNTGVEFKVNLAGIGYPGGAGSIKIAGIIVGTNYDYMSNQAIGGLTSAGTPDPYNLGFPAKDTDFNTWDGNQFVTVAVPGSPPAAPAGAAIDGKLNTNAAETTAYGAPLWTNTTNASGFGNAKNVVTPPFTVTQDRANGSELDAIYAYVANDPANSNAPTLYVMVTGNLHDFNKLVLFFDTAPGGQNDIRGDNYGFENFNGGLGGPDGFTFDTGFDADYAISYILGWDTDLAVARHFCDGTQLLTGGGGFGGRFGGGDKVGVATPITGTVIARVGFGDNNLTPLGGPGVVRSVNSNGSELDALYTNVVSDGNGGGTLYLFFAGNLEPNLTSLELFFDTIAGGQNTLVYDFRGSQDPAYTGNPDVDFGALNRMGGPVFDDMMVQLYPGMKFDTGFDADYYFSLRTGDYNATTQVSTIFANWARLRTPSDAAGPMPFPDSYRYIGNVPNDSLGGPPGFINGDLAEFATAAAIDNANIGGVGGGKHFYCHLDPAETNPANVTTGIEVAIDLADLGFGPFAIPPGPNYVPGVTQIKMMAFLNGTGHGKVANQLMQFGCTDDLGEPRNVNFQNIPGNQYVQFPTAVAAPNPCKLIGDANGDGFVNFADITSVLANFNTAGPFGDADGNGTVNFADVTAVLANFNQGNGC